MNVLSTRYQTTCITSTCVFFSTLFLCESDDVIISGGGRSQKVMIGIIISENDDNCGPPLRFLCFSVRRYLIDGDSFDLFQTIFT